MPRYILHHDGRFLVWSTVTDSPVTDSMTLEELRSWHDWQHGRDVDFDSRVARAVAKGCSSKDEQTLESVTTFNRAGRPGERCLSRAEILDLFRERGSRPEPGDRLAAPPGEPDCGEVHHGVGGACILGNPDFDIAERALEELERISSVPGVSRHSVETIATALGVLRRRGAE